MMMMPSKVKKLKVPSGLPNHRNICFLSSVIQQLYRMEVIHNVFNTEDNNEDIEESFAFRLKQLFKLMEKQGNRAEKKEVTSKIMKELEKMLINYSCGYQYDSLETFLCIFNYVTEKFKNLQEELKMEYFQSCDCSNGQALLSPIFFENYEITCYVCQSPIKKTFRIFPNYLIVKCADFGSSQRIQSLTLNHQFKYCLESMNIYIGNKQSGHYYAQCFYDDKIYEFNDDQVFLGNKWRQEKCIFAIYKKVQLKQMKSQPLIEKPIVIDRMPQKTNKIIKNNSAQNKSEQTRSEDEKIIQVESDNLMLQKDRLTPILDMDSKEDFAKKLKFNKLWQWLILFLMKIFTLIRNVWRFPN